jgi:RHO1 GDP-GTP exchange protein 1/2
MQPIPVELMTLGRFDEPAVARSVGLLRSFRSSERHNDTAENEAEPSRQLFPFTYATPGGQYTLWADSATARAEWKTAFMHAKALRQADLEANKVRWRCPVRYVAEPSSDIHQHRRSSNSPPSVSEHFTCEWEGHPPQVGSADIIMLHTISAPTYAPQAIHNELWTDRVVTTVPFRTPDNRELFGVGTAEGVWLGLRQDPRCEFGYPRRMSPEYVDQSRPIQHCARCYTSRVSPR